MSGEAGEGSSGSARVDRGVSVSDGSIWLPVILVFFTSACVMVLEIVAGRLVARHVGNSLHTWTSIIAVVLLGLSIGNVLGGRLADRIGVARTRSLLADLLGVAALASLTILWSHEWAFGLVASPSVPWGFRIFLGVTATFLFPATVLGMVSPAAAKWALELGSGLGRTVGVVYAAGSVGAIVGTIVTGFFLLAWLGTSVVIGVVAMLLAFGGLFVRPAGRSLGVTVLVVLALVGFTIGASPITSTVDERDAVWPVVHFEETAYQSIEIRRDSQGVFAFLFDDMIHGYVDPKHLAYLEYPYLQIFALLHRTLLASGSSTESLHLGGGAFTFPRYVVHVEPASEVLVVEIDPVVTRVAQRLTTLGDPPPFSIMHLDARQAVIQLREQRRSFDVVYADAFLGFGVPYHLTTREFLAEVASILERRGFIATNVIDVYASGRLLGAYVATIRTVLPYVEVIATRPPDSDGARDTFVVVAGHRPLAIPLVDLTLAGFHVLNATEVATAVRRANHLILTDEYAPVENLVADWVGGR